MPVPAKRAIMLLVDLRAAAEVTYGSAGLASLGIDGQAPSDPSVLATQGRSVLNALTNDAVKLPKRRREGMKLDRQAFARELEGVLPALEKALAQVAKEAREAEGTQAAKQQAMTAYDEAFTLGATWLSVTFALAGMDSEAGKVRPSGRRPGQTAESDPADQPEAGAPAAPAE